MAAMTSDKTLQAEECPKKTELIHQTGIGFSILLETITELQNAQNNPSKQKSMYSWRCRALLSPAGSDGQDSRRS